jgi:hypothetical protein
MDGMMRRAFGAAGFALLLATSTTLAQQQSPTVRVRGTIEGVDGPMLTVKSRDGQTTYKVRVADNVALRGVVKAPLSDIKQNSFIGVTGMPQADGSQKAVEIHIFPEALRGTGEGHRPWDLMPNSTMTNATVAQMVKGVEGDEITLKYKDGEKKIVVVPSTIIVTYVPADKSELKPGAKIFIAAANKKEMARSKRPPSRSAATASRRRCEVEVEEHCLQRLAPDRRELLPIEARIGVDVVGVQFEDALAIARGAADEVEF